MDCEEEELSALLSQQKSQDNLRAYFADPNQYLLILKTEKRDSEAGNSLELCTNIETLKLKGSAVAFVKITPFSAGGDAPIKYKKHFHVLNLGELSEDFNPYEITRSCIKNAFVPIFNRLKKVDPNKEKINPKVSLEQKMIASVQKKLTDLDVTLIQNNMAAQIPEIKFQYLPEVTKFVEDSVARNEEIKVENFPQEIMEDV